TAVAAISAGAFAAGALLGGDAASVSALPAVSGAPVKPRKGQSQAGAIYAKASPAVVSVRTGSGSGTGFLIDHGGTIVTNAHVVGTADRVVVRFGADGASIDAEVRGVDASSDLAVLEIDRKSIPRGVAPLKFADSRQVQVGDIAIAIGNPLGLDRTATEGIVSGLGRSIQAPNGYQIDEVIQTDAPINPGNSGGPLLDDTGRVIGINSQIATAGSNGNIGIGFAAPSNTIRQVVPKLIKGQKIARPYLGVQTSPASGAIPDGAEVRSVVSGGPADGILNPGDVIIRIDGKAVRDPEGVAKAVETHKPGEEVAIELRSSAGTSQSVKVRLGTRPARTP
ncbi:MAG: trypsin-like peptidase domain-containing protein, partial [Actinomycetota bacterium]|nr:trypsin-like peptidase domain-containing protein [Actinomycetota bacterium]